MNTIPDSGKWNEISSLLNANFNTIATQLLQFANVAVYNKGIHADVESLQQSYPTPMVGSFAYVGTTPPYNIYTYKATGWQDSGVDGVPMETDFSDITIATETESGLMSPEHVSTLNGFSATINAQNTEITGVKNRVGALERNSVTTHITVSGHSKKITDLEGIVNPLKSSFDEVADTVKAHTNQITSVNNSVTQIANNVSSLQTYVENNRTPIETLTQAIVKLGIFNTSGEAEKLAETYASNPSVLIMLYKTQGGASGIIYQYFSNTSATIQFLYLQGRRYVREISWGNGTVGTWKDITGPERIKTLSFNDESNILSFEDALSGKTWGGVYLPLKETAAQELAKVVANAPSDLDTLKEIADYIASDKTSAAQIEVAISNLQKANIQFTNSINANAEGIAKNAQDISEETRQRMAAGTALQNQIDTIGNKHIETVDVSELDSLIAPIITNNGKADYWVTSTYAGISLIVGRLFLIEDSMMHKSTQVLLTNNTIDSITSGTHQKEGLNVFYRFYGHSSSDVPMKQWTDWKALYDSEAPTPQEIIDYINAKLANKVDRDDNAPKLTAGFANNLVGRGEATPEEISFRPSGGSTSIEDGVAKIERVKGKSVVWNQVYTPEGTLVYSGVTATTTNGVTSLEGVTSSTIIQFPLFSENKQGHIYLFTLECDKTLDGKSFSLPNRGDTCVISNGFASLIHINRNTSLRKGIGINGFEIGETINTKVIVRQHDLTQMFNAGNEPTTIEEFEARKPLGVSDEYNEGELISNNVEAIKTVGFNAWDEQWEVGTIAFVTGNPANSTTRIRSKNFNKCLPYTQYSFSSPISGVVYYDKDKKFIVTQSSFPNKIFTPPYNANYFKIVLPEDYGTTYKNDICIHLVHTGYRNGEYEPYEEFTRSLPISEIKDKDGNQLFHNGLLSAGSVYDEVTEKKAIKRVGVVDMGTLDWKFSADKYSKFSCKLPNDAIMYSDYANKPNVLNIRYLPIKNKPALFSDKDMWRAGELIAVYDNDYTDATTFKQAMQGVMLYYELAEPIIVDLAEPINLDYNVCDFGTEEAISTKPTTQLRADIVYQFNAVDRIRENSKHANEANEILKNKQDTLVSGTSIKTINGESLLGKGDIAIGNSEYTHVLNKTFTEDVASYDVSVDVPNITSYKDFIILIEFKYQEGVSRGGWSFLLLNGDTYPKVSITANNIATESYRTHYILRLHVGDFADMTAYLESHNNAFYIPQANDGNVGMNWMCNYFEKTNYGKFKSFIFGHGFITGEKLKIYAR